MHRSSIHASIPQETLLVVPHFGDAAPASRSINTNQATATLRRMLLLLLLLLRSG